MTYFRKPLRQLCSSIFSGGTPSKREPLYFEEGTIPWLNTAEIDFNRISATKYFITEAGLANSSAKMVPSNSVTVAMYGATAGKSAFLKTSLTTNQACCNLIIDKSQADPEFIYFAVKNSYLALKNLSNGAAQQNLNVGIIKDFPIPTPPLPEQKRIAAVLGALDDKIEINRKMNETLEAMAQAIFKSWFVDFDPAIDNALRAGNPIPEDLEQKAERRRLAMARDSYKIPPYAHLFPDHFVDSELGSIPGGWKLEKLQKLSDLTWGDTNTTKKSYVESGFPAYSAKGKDGYLPHFDYERTGIVISAIGANCGTTWLAMGKWSCIKNTIRFWSVDPKIPTEFLYHATFGQAFWPRRGSAQPFISQTDARNCKILIPPDKSAGLFGDTIRTFYDKMDSNEKESHTLASLRDTLLPKLISGELRVPEIEGLVEDAL